jgi:cysteine synthase
MKLINCQNPATHYVQDGPYDITLVCEQHAEEYGAQPTTIPLNHQQCADVSAIQFTLGELMELFEFFKNPDNADVWRTKTGAEILQALLNAGIIIEDDIHELSED